MLRPMALTGLAMLCGMFLYEWLKELLHPNLTKWQSHYVTIAFSTLIATIITYYVARGNRRLIEGLQAEVAERKVAESALGAVVRENNRLAAAIDSLQIGVLITDPALRDDPAIFINPAFSGITGYAKSDFIGRNCRLLQGPDTDRAVVQHIREAIAARQPFMGTLLNYRKDGTPFWNELTINPVFDDNGQLTNFVGIQVDVTARVEAAEALRQSEARLARVTTNVPGMVYQFTLHPDGSIAFPYVSEGCRRLYGLEPAQIQQDALALISMIHPEDMASFENSVAASAQSLTPWQWEGRVVLPSGEQKWHQGASRPQRQDNGDIIWDGVLIDITERKQTTEALRESEERFRMLIQNLNEIVYEIDTRADPLRGRTTFMSEQIENIIGYRAEEFLSNPGLWFQLLHPDDVAVIRDNVPQPAGNQPVTRLYRLRHRETGDYRWLEDKVTCRLDDGGNVIGVRGLARDVTERKQAEQALQESEERFRTVAESLGEGLIITDLNDIILYCNSRVAEITEYAREEMLGRAAYELLLPPGAWPIHLNRHEQRRQGIAESYEIKLQTKSGASWWALVNATPFRNGAGEIIGTLGAITDITERKQAEEALQAAKDEAEKANRAKSEFLSRMSHELRTPLNAIIGFGQLLEMARLQPRQQEQVAHVLKAGHHLLDLINEVLDMARIEAGRIELSLEPVPVRDTLRETLDLILPLAAQRGIRLDFTLTDAVTPFVLADRQRFKQVLLNILANAVKYNSVGGAVTVSWEETGGEALIDGMAAGPVSRQHDGTTSSPELASSPRLLRIRITDTGPGIPAASMDRLFVPFDRLDAEHSEVQGTGLGLALSQRLMQAMGGTIGVASTVGQGTTFWVELPRVASPLHLAQSTLSNGAGASQSLQEAIHQRKTVLYIEDNLSNLSLIEHLIEKQPQIRLITALQGQLGLDLAQEHHPDLILLDLHLPDLPGWEVLARLQASAATRDIPVVVVSADATPQQIKRLMEAGVRAYLTKPLDVRQFFAILETMANP